ncbi:MAG TPA: zeta toxin family protein [Gammaproteobacteria bacterium]|nr:zeta toxin family protein [Gammaproteobacteria bacterium]
MPHIIVIAGPNGAGKTTAAPALLGSALQIDHFVNADTIAAGLSAFAPEKVAIQAGKAMLERMQYLAENNENFAFETTLASKTFAPWIARLKKEKGYLFHLTFLVLDSPVLAISRVAERVKMGGHSVPENTIKRRFESGLKNFFRLYKPLADSWQMYDNTLMGNLTPIASKIDKLVDVQAPEIWQGLLEKYDDTSKK